MTIETRNARITGTTLGVEDHGIFSCMLHLDYGGAMQGFGGFSLDEPIKDANGKFLRRQGSALGAEFLMRVLAVTGASSWEKLPGTPVRVRADYNKVYAIGHYIEERWFYPEHDLKYMTEAR